MAQTKTAAEQGSSLQDFSFDNEEWFGQKPDKNEETGVNKTIKEVKGSKIEGSGQSATNIEDAEDNSEEEDEEEDVTFFGEKETKVKVAPTKKSEEEQEQEEEIEDEDEKEEEDEEEDENKVVKKKAKPVESKTTEEDDAKFYTTLASELKEKNILQNIELDDKKEYTEDEFFELVKQDVDARINEAFEAFAEELDEDAKAFIKFKKEGGKTADFLTHYASSFDLEELDAKDEKQVQKTLTYYLTKFEKLDSEELADRLTWLKEGGKEKAYAIKYFEIIQDEKESKQQAIIKAQEDRFKSKQEEVKEFNTELDKVLKTTKSVGAFTITPEDQKKLGAFMTKPTEKIGKDRFAPKMQVKLAEVLRAKTPEAKQKFILLGKLLLEDFDTTDIVTTATTQVAKKTKSKLREMKNNSVRAASVGGGGTRQLTDYFNE